jgi:CubicO group peptidase (beta-lactamase class C family)
MVLRVKVPPDLVGGDVDDGYGRIADVFRRNLASGQEVGAAVAVYRDGRKVVDLWGGYRNGNTRQPWREDTLVLVFSGTKGISALTVAVAVSQGLLSYDAKVCDHWPDFAQEGKGDITVRQLMSHQAGLPAIRPPLTREDLADTEGRAAKLAAQKPAWEPGTRHGYHVISLGWFAGELIRRADPAERSLGRFFADELAHPLGLDFYIGLPESVDRERIAHLHAWTFRQMLLHLRSYPPGFLARVVNPFSLEGQAVILAKGLNAPGMLNRDELRVIELPANNGTGTARSMARLYGSAATGGAEIGLRGDVFESLTEMSPLPSGGARDVVLHTDTRFSLGFTKPYPKLVFGSSDKPFGTPGAGGSFGFADPDTGKSPGVVGFRVCGWPGWAVSGVSLRALGWAIA